MLKQYKILLYIMIIISILLCLPSVIHLIQNGSVETFEPFNSYTYGLEDSFFIRKLNWGIFTFLIILFSFIYLLIIKYENNIFKNKKQIYIFIFIISILFTSILFYLMYDIFYYMGDAWLCAEYGENPYYTTVKQLQDRGITDKILENTGPWKDTITVYGPVWNIIAIVLMYFSFGSLNIGLLLFKILALSMHMLNCYFIGKITKNNKYMLLYGLNPLILIDGLSNLHNDLYLVTFTLAALYFLIRKKNIILTLISLAISVAIKYTTILIIPFILIYIFKDKTIIKRILYCLLSGISIILLVILMYLPFYEDITLFTKMLLLKEVYSQSILSILKISLSSNVYTYISSAVTISFVLIYIILFFKFLLKKALKINEIFRSYNLFTLLFIFLVLTNFHQWYILWIMPTIIWQKKYMRYFILAMTISALIYPIGFYITHSDAFRYGMTYSVKILIRATIITTIIYILDKTRKPINKNIEQKGINI